MTNVKKPAGKGDASGNTKDKSYGESVKKGQAPMPPNSKNLPTPKANDTTGKTKGSSR